MSVLDTTPASDLERRKQVRLRLRGDLSITPQKYEGRTYFVVKDPISLRYYRFKEQEHFLIQLMDGTHTLDDAQKEFEKRFRPERLTLEDLEQFSQQLLNAGLVQNESPQAGKQLFDRRKKRKRSELMQRFTNILYIKIPLFDPDRTLTRMIPYFRWVFTLWFFALSVVVMLSAVFLVLTHFETFLSRLPSYHEFFSFKTVIYLWAALGIVKVIHEFGHGVSCKAFGGEVHEMGLLFLCLSPAMFCNVSDAWTMPSKWKRIIISFAGIYVELMIAAVATFVWWNTPSQPFLNNLALSLMIVCSVSTIVFNGNPLMRFDGYYVLSDWLEIPNLREKANRYIGRLAMQYALGIEVQPEPYMERWRRVLFISYAVLSWCYRWLITFIILRFLYSFLAPYKLQIISQMLTAVAVGSMFGWPLYRLFKNIKRRGRLPDMKSQNLMVTGLIVAGILATFFLLPLPVTRIREPGLVQLQHKPVYFEFEEPSILTKIHVRESQPVKRGQMLAEFSNPKLETLLEQAKSEIAIAEKMLSAYRSRITLLTGKEKKEVLDRALEASNSLRDAHRKRLQVEKDMEALVLRAEEDGVIMGLPRYEEVGKSWKRGDPAFCSIGDPRKLKILVPVTQANFELLIDNMKRRDARTPLAVTIRVQGHGGTTWAGKVGILPKAEEKNIPVALSTRGGGPLAVKPSGDPNQMAPQEQIYLVPVEFLEPDEAVMAGSMAQVKIHCDYRPMAWSVWRWISGTFDLGLTF